jgi:hypothetical protein
MSDGQLMTPLTAAWLGYMEDNGYSTVGVQPDTGADFAAGYLAAFDTITSHQYANHSHALPLWIQDLIKEARA